MCYPQVMSDLLSAWVLSSSSPNSAPAPDPSTGLSQALDQARLSYHAQEVRRMAATGDPETERREMTASSNTSSRTSSMRKMRRRPPPGTGSSKQSVMTSVTGDSGVVSGSNSTVTDTDRRFLDVEGMEDSGKSTPSERSKDDILPGSPNQIDLLDFTNDGSFSEQDFDDVPFKENPKQSPTKSKLPKVLPKERNGADKRSTHKPPEPLSPNKLPRYPSVVKKKKSEIKRDSEENQIRKIKAEESKEKTKSNIRRSDHSLRRSKTEFHDEDSEEEKNKPSNKRNPQNQSSPSKSLKPKKKPTKFTNDIDDDESDFEREVKNVRAKSNGMKRDESPNKSRSPVKKSPVKKSKKSVNNSDDSDEDIKPIKSKLRGGESPTKSRSVSPVKKNSRNKIGKSERKSRKEISDEEDFSEEEVKSPKKNGKKKLEASPIKTKKSQSQSPVKNGRNRRESSPIKKSKKDMSKSEFRLDEDDYEEEMSPKKSKKGKLSRSKSESASLADKKRNKSPVKKKRGVKADPEYSEEEDEEDDEVTISEKSDGKNANKPKPKKLKDVVFSDEEEDSPFGISGKGGKNYWRRNTYLDILKIEKERRETINKMKAEKEKEREKNGGKGEKKEKFIRDSFGNKVFLSSKGKKDSENDAPDNIDIAVDDIVSKTLIISSQSNYGRNRDSLASMIKRKLKEDHYLRSLCQTDEWFLKSIISAMVSFGPLIKVITKTQALTWIFLARLTQFWTKDGKQPPGEKELLADPETIAFATELCKLCYKLLASDQVDDLFIIILTVLCISLKGCRICSERHRA